MGTQNGKFGNTAVKLVPLYSAVNEAIASDFAHVAVRRCLLSSHQKFLFLLNLRFAQIEQKEKFLMPSC